MKNSIMKSPTVKNSMKNVIIFLQGFLQICLEKMQMCIQICLKFLIAWIRLLVLLLVTLMFLVVIILFYWITPKWLWICVIKLWGRCITYCAGATVEIIGNCGQYQQHNAMVIANHISWLDIPVLCRLYAIRFIGRAEIKSWPLFGLLIKAGGTIFIDRAYKKDLLRVKQILSKILIKGSTIGFFPEGKTSNGDSVLQFKASLFEPAIIAKSQIIPIVIVYYDRHNRHTKAVTYADKITLWQTIYNTLLLNHFTVKVILLPTVNAIDFNSREELATYLFNQIKSTYLSYTHHL